MMPSLHMGAIAARLGLPWSGAAQSVAGLCIDSRQLRPGELFVALPGARVDGHDFVAAAAAAGAVAALVQRPVTAALPCLQVPDTLAAMSDIAAANRDAYAGEVVAITGSCGKTSVKQLCKAILGACAPTVATAGNFNNEIGVPLTLGRLGADTRFAVIEMGARGRGQVAQLCRLARPRVGTVLNAMEAHLEGFGSLDDVADIKAEIFDGLGSAGVGVVNADQRWSPGWRRRVAATGAQLLTWSLDGAGDVTAADIEERGLAGSRFRLCHGGASVAVELALPGRHNVANALAAAALALACGLELPRIADGLAAARGEPGRSRAETLGDGTLLVDDSYNANPGSVRAAIALLAASAGHRALLLGEMLELGAASEALHREMGERARRAGIDAFWGVGAALAPAVAAFGSGGRLFPDRAAAAAACAELPGQCDVILVKGSRGAAMETLAQALRVATGGSD